MHRLVLVCFAMVMGLFSATTSYSAGGKIIIAIIPEQNLVKQMERFVPLCNYLEKKIGMEVDLKPLSNYGQIYEEMRDGNIDAGFFGSFVYVMTRVKLGIEPVVRPVRPGGSSTYTGLTFVRKDSGIRGPSDMKGKAIALADPATSAGYIVQKEYLKNNGVDIDRDLRIIWAGSHDAAIRAVLNHQADIGGAKDTIVRKYQKDNKVFDTVINIINEGPGKGLPDNTFAVRKGLSTVVREKLKRAFMDMSSDTDGRKTLERFGATRFIETRDDDFISLYELVKHLKMDLSTYPYKKR